MIDPDKIRQMFLEIHAKTEKVMLLNSVRKGLTLMIPLLLLGSIALMFLSLPVPGYQCVMGKIFGDHWREILIYVRDGTVNILSLLMVLCIGYAYAIERGERYGNNVNPMIVASVSLASFIALLGMSKAGFTFTNFGVNGIFVAIVTGIIATKLFLKLSSVDFFKIKSFSNGSNSSFSYAVTSIYPAVITITSFAIINQILVAHFGIYDIQNYISNIISDLVFRMKSPFWSAILYIFFMHIFWFFGLHGNDILEPVTQKVFGQGYSVSQGVMAVGQGNSQIFTKTFFDTFILMGGCGATLCLIGAIFFAGKLKTQKRFARLSLLPVIFNINELIVFGIPIVLNPVYFIPFLLIPIILTINSFLAMYFGLVPCICNPVEWTTPVFLSGFAATNSIRGSILQLVNLVLGVLCYIPFVKLEEKSANIRMKASLEKVYDLYKHCEKRGISAALLARHDDVGNISRFLVDDLVHDLNNNKIALFYQPQVDHEGNVFGAEALLRWNHDSYGYIYPPLVIALAEEAGFIDKLGYWIIDTACNDLKKINKLGLANVTVSVNVSAVQLESESFIVNLEATLQKYNINPQELQIEITEQVALSSGKILLNQISSIKKLGVGLAMDDFGMGHSSLMYLKEYNFDTVKLDGSLVRELLSNSNCSNIISSILFLGKSMNYSVLAEYVECEEQKRLLHELGCDEYQGYLFSPALPYRELIEYIMSKKA